jgi:predicted chitinase
VQLTGRYNYQNWSDELDENLVDKPELAAKPKIAAKILVQGMQDGSFTGKKLSDYINAEKQDFFNARQIVNDHDKAKKISQDAERYYDAIV